MRRLAWMFPLVLSAFGTVACSSDSGDDGGEDTGGSGGSATGGTSGSSTGGSTTGGSSGAATGGSTSGGSSGASTGGSAGSATGGSGGSAGAGFTKRGVCGQKSDATVTTTAYAGTEEYYMVSEENVAEGLLDEYICLVRFDVTRVGEAPANCVDLQGMPCLWTHKVEFSNPTVVTNVDGACEKNEFLWDAAWRAGVDGTQASYGFIYMYEGHDSVVMKAHGSAGSETWDVFGRASWVEETGELSFDNRIGECRY